MLLLDRLALRVRDRFILNLLYQYMNRTAESGGWFWEHERGISLGCPLSPLIGAFFLDELDQRMTATGLFYVRFMDDILVLAPTRWKLRRAVGLVNQILGALRLEKHPDKTFIGRIARGFDFLGYHFTADSLTLAVGTLANFADRVSRLYEQEREGPTSPSRLGAYVRRWCAWASGGLATLSSRFTPPPGGAGTPWSGCPPPRCADLLPGVIGAVAADRPQARHAKTQQCQTGGFRRRFDIHFQGVRIRRGSPRVDVNPRR
jgi:hypothetical protein